MNAGTDVIAASTDIPSAREILAALLRFETLSLTPNSALLDYVESLFLAVGIDCQRIPGDAGAERANLYATVGPTERGGVMLSGHTDVVPVEGQAWQHPPFELTEANGRYYGRGTADMKGFVACAIHAMLRAASDSERAPLRTPLHLALSYDEEIGCIGVRSLVDLLHHSPVRPALCIVGEPTGMAVATGHKGKIAVDAVCTGLEGHSALAPMALNAIHLATDLVQRLRALQAELEASGARDGDYDVPYTTVHVGRIDGGIALNIVPARCEVAFEIRAIAADSIDALLARIQADCEAIVTESRTHCPAPEAAPSITLHTRFAYPGLDTPPDSDAIAFVRSLTGGNATIKVAFGTEGGLFHAAGIPVVICGPGSMAQGHKPDEFVSIDQFEACGRMLDALLRRLRETNLPLRPQPD